VGCLPGHAGGWTGIESSWDGTITHGYYFGRSERKGLFQKNAEGERDLRVYFGVWVGVRGTIGTGGKGGCRRSKRADGGRNKKKEDSAGGTLERAAGTE